jgi:UrcA family protein
MKQGLKIAMAAFTMTAGLIKGAPAFAEQPAQPNVNVSYVRTADLDLSTATGRHQLDRRLSVAAREVCGTASDVDLEGKNDVRKCRDEVLARAGAQADALLAKAERGGVIAIAAR